MGLNGRWGRRYWDCPHARQEECMGSAPPPPPTLGQLKQTEDVDEEADVLDRFSVYVEHSGGDWQKDDSM